MQKSKFLSKNIKFEYGIFFVAILICYFNVILYPQIYYDDYINVFSLTLIGDGFNLHSIINALKFRVGGFRPISYLSFYLNHQIFNGSIRAFVITNVIIHFFNTIILYHLAKKLTNSKEVGFITALIWAVAPVNIFAVSYIVQRMTALMVFFGGIATLFYLEWEDKRQLKYLLFSILFVVLSALSKESGILFIGFFIAHYYIKNGTKKDIIILYVTGFLFLIFFYIFCKNYFEVGYIKRQITPIQRILTETRALVFYIKNIVFPTSNNIFLLIDIKHSQGILKPITTLFSIIFISFLLVLSLVLVKKDKIISLGILGFFCFHVIESTSLPLMTMFFHRNYMASFFLLLAVVKAVFYLKKQIRNIILIILVINSTWVTIVHNLEWRYKPFYIKENYKNFPESTDAKLNYASLLAKQGKLNKALKIYLATLKTNKFKYSFENIIKLLQLKGLNKEAIELSKLIPDKSANLNYIMALSYAEINDYKNAEKHFEKTLDMSFSFSKLLAFAFELYNKGYYDSVIWEIEKYSDKVNEHIKMLKHNKSLKSISIQIGKLYLLKIECEVRLGMQNKIEQDIGILKKLNLFNSNIANYIKALKLMKEQEYSKALEKLNSIKYSHLNDLGVFIKYKKTVFTLCIYDKTGQEEKFKDLIEKFSKNTIIYDSIWQGLDKCY